MVPSKLLPTRLCEACLLIWRRRSNRLPDPSSFFWSCCVVSPSRSPSPSLPLHSTQFHLHLKIALSPCVYSYFMTKFQSILQTVLCKGCSAKQVFQIWVAPSTHPQTLRSTFAPQCTKSPDIVFTPRNPSHCLQGCFSSKPSGVKLPEPRKTCSLEKVSGGLSQGEVFHWSVL